MPLRKHLLLSIFLFVGTGLPSIYSYNQLIQPKILYLANPTHVDQVRSDSAWAMLQYLCSLQNIVVDRYNLSTGWEKMPELSAYKMVVLTENPVYSFTNLMLRQRIESYLLGDEDRDGGNLLLLFDKEQKQQSAISEPYSWQWFKQLLSPDFLNLEQRETEDEEVLILQATTEEREAQIVFGQISYSRQLPHPTDKPGMKGGKVFVTYLGKSVANFSRDSDGNFVDPLFVNHIGDAIQWQLEGTNHRELNIDYLDMSAWPDKNQVRLEWQAKADRALNTFRLFRAENKSSWENIYQITSSSAKKEVQTFEYMDRDRSPGRYYYRLNSKKPGAAPRNSRIIVVDVGGLHPDLTLFPNPARQNLFVNIGLLRNSKVQLSIESKMGEKLLVRDLGEVDDGHKERLAIGHFSPGLYIIRVKAGEAEAVKNFVKYD